MIKNDLFLRALKGETVDRPPVWMMRQAGRYLPEFMEIKAKYDFFTRCQTPELASEITVQPIRRYGMDAAILFCDILVIPQAMNIEVEMKPGLGPWLPNPIRSAKDVEQVIVPDIDETLGYVMDAIKMTKEKLNNEIPLIGFAGSPWTILCYCVQGQGSKNFDKAKEFCFTQPLAAHALLQKITDTTIAYLKKKVEAGVNAVQVFDSWGGMLSPVDYQEFSWQYIQQIIDALKDETPVIAFGKGCWFALDQMSTSGAAALGVDWTCSPKTARALTNNSITLQGNFDPTRLFSPPKEIKRMVHEMINEFGKDKYIVNLGHGILPNIPIENAGAFIEAVKRIQSLVNIGAVIKSMDFRQLWSLFCLSIRHLRFVIPTIRGTRRTVAICDELYKDKHHQNGPENAFRHALWNALIVQRSVKRKLPLDRSLAWAKTITDWHEDFSPNKELARAMDLHNNRVGRNLIALFPDESEDFLIGQLLKMFPLSRKRTQIEQLVEDIGFLVHIDK